MGLFLKRSILCLGISVLDIIACTLSYAHLTEFRKYFVSDLQQYTFWECQFDLWVLCVLRLLILISCISLTAAFRERFVSKLRSSGLLVVVVSLVMTVYSPIKLLAYAEITDDFTDVYFWCLFTWNIIASLFLIVEYIAILSKFVPSISALSLLIPTPGQDDDDTEALISEDNDTLAESETNDTESAHKQRRKKEKTDKEKMEAEIARLGAKKKTSLFFRLLAYCKGEWRWYLIGSVGLLFYSGARIFIPYYTGQIISTIVLTHSYTSLTHSVIIMVLLSIVSGFFGGIRGGAFTYGFSKVNLTLRNQLFSSLLSQEIGFYDTTKTGEITSRLTADTQTMSDTVSLNINVFLRSFVMFIGSLVFMFRLSWKLAVVNFIALPLITIISEVYGKYYERLQKDVQDTLAKANEVADEVVGTMRTVRSFAGEKLECDRYSNKLAETLGVKKKQAIMYAGYIWISEVFDLSLLVAVLWYGGHLVIENKMLKENLIAYLLYQIQLGETLWLMGQVYTGIMTAVGASHKVFQYMDREPAIKQDGKLQSANLEGRVDFKDVCFAYPSRPDAAVLNDINFSVASGEVVALVGPSGGGKSSCIALMEHFYEPTSGQILIDGVPVQKYDHKFLHTKIALVGQEPVLYAKSVTENIAYGIDPSEWTQTDVERVARLANAHQFVTEMPDGYETETGEKGVQLSGGQKQRVAIARALIRRPKILLLDEATSALDSESEYLVQQAIYRNLSGHTVILIAHRLSTVEKADRIVVINKGRVVQQGSHHELLQQDGIYKNLVHRQLLATGDSTSSADKPPPLELATTAAKSLKQAPPSPVIMPSSSLIISGGGPGPRLFTKRTESVTEEPGLVGTP